MSDRKRTDRTASERDEGKEKMDWALRVSREVAAEGGPAEEELCHKCRWEGMTRTGVILEWGDPREWPRTKERRR